MSGVCPTPGSRVRTDNSTPLTFDLQTPDAVFNDCTGTVNTDVTPGGDPVATIKCCPNPGIPGPKGDKGDNGLDGLDGEDGLGFKWEGLWTIGSAYVNQENPTLQASVVTHQMPTGDDDWFDAFEYARGDGVYDMDNIHYTCIAPHTSEAANEAGIGPDWQDYWEVTDTAFLPHALFICIVDHTASALNEPVWGDNADQFWELMVSADGTNVIAQGGLRYRGKWSPDGITYVKDDVLTHKNSSYVCIKAHTSIAAENGTATTPGNEPDLSLAEENGGLFQSIFSGIAGFFGFGETNNAPSEYWELLSKGEQDSQGFLGGIFDWLGDVTGWEIFNEGWFQSAVSILGAAGATYYLNEWLKPDEFTWQARFDGDDGYIGPYTKPKLPAVIASICDEAGIVNYDVSSLPERDVSMALSTLTNYRSMLEMLSQAYQFDIVSTFDPGTGRLLAFRPRNMAPVKTLTLKDLGYDNGFVGAAPFEAGRAQGNDLPRSVELSYFSAAFSERRLTQSSIMRTYDQGQDFKLELPLSLDDAQAKEICDITMMNAHLERASYAFNTTLEHIDIEAGDVVTVEKIGDIRIQSVSSSQSKEGLLEFVGVDAGIATVPQPVFRNGVLVGTSASSVGSSLIGPIGPVVPPDQEQVKYYSTTGMIPLDLPALNNNDKTPRLHFGLHGYGASVSGNLWPGAFLQMSRDGGTSWTNVGNTSTATKWGLVETAIPAPANFNVVDEVTEIEVELKGGGLTSAGSDLEFYNGVNRCMVGQELIYFRDATSLGGRRYKLSYLLRGRKGTDGYMDTHQNDEGFVLLNEDALIVVPLNQEDFRVPLLFRAQTLMLNQNSATPVEITPQFMNIRGWRVANATIGYDPVTKAYAGAFLRRYKWDSSLVNGRSNIPDDDLAGYKVGIVDTTTDTIVREFVVTNPQFVYTLDQQVEDFGAQQATLTVSIVPMSRIIGPGHPTIVTYGI